MKKESLRKIIKECVKSVVSEMEDWEPYDDQTGDVVPAPRDRTEPSQPETSAHRKISQEFRSGKKFLVLTPQENNTFKAELYNSKDEAYNVVKNTPHSIFYITKEISGFYK